MHDHTFLSWCLLETKSSFLAFQTPPNYNNTPTSTQYRVALSRGRDHQCLLRVKVGRWDCPEEKKKKEEAQCNTVATLILMLLSPQQYTCQVGNSLDVCKGKGLPFHSIPQMIYYEEWQWPLDFTFKLKTKLPGLFGCFSHCNTKLKATTLNEY